jgi:hypothetical protein
METRRKVLEEEHPHTLNSVANLASAYRSTFLNSSTIYSHHHWLITGYALMTDQELGLDTFMKQDTPHLSVTVADTTTKEDVALALEARC